jgi:hypothetical protein
MTDLRLYFLPFVIRRGILTLSRLLTDQGLLEYVAIQYLHWSKQNKDIIAEHSRLL